MLAAVAALVIVLVLIAGLQGAWGRHHVVYTIDILLPNVMLMIVPGAIVAGAYLLIARSLVDESFKTS